MIELRDWIASAELPQRTWLLLGKGPSFSRRHEVPLDEYNLLGLNDVVNELRVDIAHLIDVEALERCADRLPENCRYLIMPRRPHVRFQPTDRRLEDFFEDFPVLGRLAGEGRLVWYNAPSSAPVGRSPVIRVRNFSSEAALDILGEMGASRVRSLGVDGGSRSSSEFKIGSGARERPLPSYDAQFRELEDIAKERGIDYGPLDEEPLRVFVGVDESQIVAARVLEHTIRKHASRPVRLIPMLDLPTPTPKDPENRARTGFSFSRFQIPKLAGYQGRALYLDADMQVFGDIAELWDIPFGDNRVLCTRQDEPPPQWQDNDWFKPGRQMSVMMLDCSRLDWDIDAIVESLDSGEHTYASLLFDLSIVPHDEVGDYLPPEWNHLEQYEPGVTKLLHYTVVQTQPWKNDENPLRGVWEPAFKEALAADVVHAYEVRRLVRAGYLKASLVGRRPVSKPLKAANRAIAKAERVLVRAEKRFRPFRRPTIMRLRSRLGVVARRLGRSG